MGGGAYEYASYINSQIEQETRQAFEFLSYWNRLYYCMVHILEHSITVMCTYWNRLYYCIVHSRVLILVAALGQLL